MTLEKAFCSWFSCLFSECLHNLGVCRGQWFQHAVLPRSQCSHYSSRLVLSPPRLPTSFTLSNICKWACFATHLHMLERVKEVGSLGGLSTSLELMGISALR